MGTRVISLVDQINWVGGLEAEVFGGLQIILKSKEAVDAVQLALKEVADEWGDYSEFDSLSRAIEGCTAYNPAVCLCEDSDATTLPNMISMLKDIDVRALLTDMFGEPELENSPIVSLGWDNTTVTSIGLCGLKR